jgi:hypothetical protein
MLLSVIAVSLLATLAAVFIGWRLARRVWSLPCPTLLAWSLESSLFDRISGTAITLERTGLGPGQRILEIGPGPGRLLAEGQNLVLAE